MCENHPDPVYEEAAAEPYKPLRRDVAADNFEFDTLQYLNYDRVGTHHAFFFFIRKIESKIKSIFHYELLRGDPELALIACNSAEKNISSKWKSKICKKTIVIEALRKCFEMTQEEIDATCLLIDHYAATGMIKKPTTAHKVARYARKGWEYYFRF